MRSALDDIDEIRTYLAYLSLRCVCRLISLYLIRIVDINDFLRINRIGNRIVLSVARCQCHSGNNQAD